MLRFNAKQFLAAVGARGQTLEDAACALEIGEVAVRSWVKGLTRPQVSLWPFIEAAYPGSFTEISKEDQNVHS